MAIALILDEEGYGTRWIKGISAQRATSLYPNSYIMTKQMLREDKEKFDQTINTQPSMLRVVDGNLTIITQKERQEHQQEKHQNRIAAHNQRLQNLEVDDHTILQQIIKLIKDDKPPNRANIIAELQKLAITEDEDEGDARNGRP